MHSFLREIAPLIIVGVLVSLDAILEPFFWMIAGVYVVALVVTGL
jgi:hypothetical protein